MYLTYNTEINKIQWKLDVYQYIILFGCLTSISSLNVADRLISDCGRFDGFFSRRSLSEPKVRLLVFALYLQSVEISSLLPEIRGFGCGS